MSFQVEPTREGTLECVVLSPIDYVLLDTLHSGTGERVRTLISQPIQLDKELARLTGRFVYWNVTAEGSCLSISIGILTLGLGLIPFIFCSTPSFDRMRSTIIQKLLDTGLRPSDFTVMDIDEGEIYHKWKVFITVQNQSSQGVDPRKMVQLEELKKKERVAQRRATQNFQAMAAADAHGYIATGGTYSSMGKAEVRRASALHAQRVELEHSIECGLQGRTVSTRISMGAPVRILMVGLDGAGKTTILHKLKLGKVIKTNPTTDFNVETVEYKNIFFTSFDIGAQDNIRPFCRQYYQGIQALIFVVDSADTHRIDIARAELHRMLNEDELRDVCLLVFANKQDHPSAPSASEMADNLDLFGLSSCREWFIQGCSAAPTGDGLYEGIDWLTHTLMEPKKPDECDRQIGKPELEPEDEAGHLNKGNKTEHPKDKTAAHCLKADAREVQVLHRESKDGGGPALESGHMKALPTQQTERLEPDPLESKKTLISSVTTKSDGSVSVSKNIQQTDGSIGTHTTDGHAERSGHTEAFHLHQTHLKPVKDLESKKSLTSSVATKSDGSATAVRKKVLSMDGSTEAYTTDWLTEGM